MTGINMVSGLSRARRVAWLGVVGALAIFAATMVGCAKDDVLVEQSMTQQAVSEKVARALETSGHAGTDLVTPQLSYAQLITYVRQTARAWHAVASRAGADFTDTRVSAEVVK